jgi:hypothetical protein
MDDVYVTRKRKLLLLLEEAGGVKKLAERVRQSQQKIDPDAAAKDYANVISQLKGAKTIGAKLARVIEGGMGKPKNWMDQMLEPGDAEMERVEASQILMNMKPERRDEWLQYGRFLAAKDANGPSAALPFQPPKPPIDVAPPAKSKRKPPKRK